MRQDGKLNAEQQELLPRTEFRVVWKREGLARKERRFAKRDTAERFLVLFGPDPWLYYGTGPDKRCCSGLECACGGLTERQRVAEERARMPALEYARVESRPVGEWSSTTAILCGGCERVLDYIPKVGRRITVDGLLMIKEAGWRYNGVAWECEACLASADEQERAFGESGASQDRD